MSLTNDALSVTRPDLPPVPYEEAPPPVQQHSTPAPQSQIQQQKQQAARSASSDMEAEYTQPPVYRRPHPMGGKPKKLPRSSTAVPDTVLDGADFDGLTVRAASVRGEDHRYLTEPRQDSAALWSSTLGGVDTLLCCVADGLGSQPNSHMGSELACRLLRNEFERRAGAGPGPWDDPAEFGREIIGRVVSGMFGDADARRIDAETLSTTLVAAVVEITSPDRQRRTTILRVGDSTAYVLRDGVFQECFENFHKDDEVQGAATSALPGNPGAVETGTVLLGNDDVLVLCTDGLSNPMHNDEVRTQLAKWWGGGSVPGILEFGWQLGFRAKSYGDDRSAVCVWGR